MNRQPTTDTCQLARLLGTGTEITLGMLARYRGPASVFSVLLGQMDTPIAELPIEQRCCLAIYLAIDVVYNKPDLFLMALDYKLMAGTFRIDHDCEEDVMTLLPAAAGGIGQLALHRNYVPEDIGWISIIENLVAAGADLHAPVPQSYCQVSNLKLMKTDSQITPFMFMLATTASGHSIRCASSRRNLELVMRLWISILFNSGVDLQVYGQRESLTWVNIETCTSLHDFDYNFGQIRLLGFEFGPSLKDWKLWQNEQTDGFAGDFWQMIERRVEIMPGTWVE